jgi:hypothetical protein
MVNNYYSHSSLLRSGNEKLNNPQQRPSNKSLHHRNETQYLDHGRVGNKNVYHEEKRHKHSYDERPPNTDHELTDGGSLQGWRDFKHGFAKGFGMVAKVAPLIL